MIEPFANRLIEFTLGGEGARATSSNELRAMNERLHVAQINNGRGALPRGGMSALANCQLIGRWRITESDIWDRHNLGP